MMEGFWLKFKDFSSFPPVRPPPFRAAFVITFTSAYGMLVSAGETYIAGGDEGEKEEKVGLKHRANIS